LTGKFNAAVGDQVQIVGEALLVLLADARDLLRLTCEQWFLNCCWLMILGAHISQTIGDYNNQ
jgi:hypothetical protein